MKKTLAFLGLTACLVAAPALAQNATTPHYDLMFKGGTLDEIPAESTLIYSRDVANRDKPDAARRDTGNIALGFTEDAGKTMATLTFRQDGKHKTLGSFPASVGNPMIMYFYETVVRDMAETAGGSPFYIRNRVKDALIEPAEVTSGTAEWNGETVETQLVTLKPFADDPNRAEMKGWGDLEMTVTMSEEVPGWYLELAADVPAAEGDAPIYRSQMRYETTEGAR